MCGRFSLEVLLNQLVIRYQLKEESKSKWHPSYNIAPEQTAPIIINENENILKMSKWGYIPHWAKSQLNPIKSINARAETVATSPSFRSSFESNRCIVPFSHFYEWKKEKIKVPYAISLNGENIGSFAGIYSKINDQITFAIITTQPNSLMKPIHNRMPVILPKTKEKKWLSNKTSKEQLERLLLPYPEKEMNAFPISTLVNSPRNNSPEILFPSNARQERLF